VATPSCLPLHLLLGEFLSSWSKLIDMEQVLIEGDENGGDQRIQGINEAAWKLEDALNDRRVEKYPKSHQAREAYFEAVTAEINYNRALFVMVLLTILETPAWCNTDLDFKWDLHAHERCHVKLPSGRHADLLLSGVPYIPPGWGIVIELILIGIFATKFIKQRRLQVNYFSPIKVDYESQTIIKYGMLLLLFEVADVAFFLVFRPRVRFALFARTGYLCLLPAISSLFNCIQNCIWEMVSVAVFLIGVIVFFAWIAMTIFSVTDQPLEGFTSFGTSLNSMFMAGVSEEFVQVFLGSYTKYRWVGVMWLAFLVLAHVLLLNLVLDSLVSSYMKFSESEEEKKVDRKVGGMLKSFKTLALTTGDDEGQVDKETFLQFVEAYGNSPRATKVPPVFADIIFKSIDRDNSGKIDEEEFCDICIMIQYQFSAKRKNSYMKDLFPKLWNSKPYKRFINWCEDGKPGEPSSFDRFMNWVLLVNLTLVVVESTYDLNEWTEPGWMDWLELAFSFVYLGEFFLKICWISFEEYWSSPSNKFDFFTTWLLLCSSLAERMSEGNMSTYANMLRLLRLLRVLKQLKNLEAVQFMADTIAKLVCASQDMMTLLGMAVFLFTTLSVQFFGGELYEERVELQETAYVDEHMMVLNCNDTLMAFGVWIVMLLREYEPNFPDAVSKVSKIPYSWIIFPIFYVFGVSIVFELVKAFTIEVFMTLDRERQDESHFRRMKEFEEAIGQFQKEFAKRGENLHWLAAGDVGEREAIKKALMELAGESDCEGEGHEGHEGHEGKEEH